MVANEATGFGEVLRRYRTAAAVSQEELAERTGLSARGIGDLERGTRPAPRLETVRRLADVLGLGPADRAALLAAREAGQTEPRAAAPSTGADRPPLPVPPTSLVGREHEVAVAVELLGRPEVRLVTLTGPGGVGKTRLALAVAAEVAANHADAARLVELAQVREPALVAATLAQALGLRPVEGEPPEAGLRRFLGARRMLLVLDNFEQILDAAPLVADLLAGCPGLKVLATSRAPLRLRGERELAVRPLSLPDRDDLPPLAALAGMGAVRLFMERARDVQPVFGLTAANASAIAAIVRRLDGLPLAIELAAARTKILPPELLLDRLGDRFALLTGGPRDLPARQRTMYDAIAWSYELLSPEEQALFRRLAVFAGGFTLEAAAAVGRGNGPDSSLDPRPSTLDLVASLVDKSLLHQLHGPDGGVRFTMLETIREFGLERLAAGGEDRAVRDAHAAYVLGLARTTAEDWFGPGFATCLARWTPEHANLRLALEWLVRREDAGAALELAAAVVFFWFYHGPVGEGRDWLDRLLARPGGRPAPARAKALEWAANLAGKQGDVDRAAARAAEAVAVARASGDRRCLSFALCTLGGLLRQQGRAGETAPLFEEALVLFRELGLAAFAAVPLLNLGLLAADAGDDERAWALCTEALELRLREGNQAGAAIVRHALADLARTGGDWDRGAALYADNLAVYQALGDQIGLADSFAGLALARADAIGPEAAVRALAAAAEVRDTVGAAIHAGLRGEHAAFLDAARAALGEAGFAGTWAAGRGLPLEQAIAETTALAEAAAAEAPPTPPTAASSVGTLPPPVSAAAAHGLTPRELEVLRLVAAGLTDRQIGEALFISHATARTHVGRVLAKLGAGTRTAAASFAHLHGLV